MVLPAVVLPVVVLPVAALPVAVLPAVVLPVVAVGVPLEEVAVAEESPSPQNMPQGAGVAAHLPEVEVAVEPLEAVEVAALGSIHSNTGGSSTT